MGNEVISFDDANNLMAFEDLDAGLGQVQQDTHVPGFDLLFRMTREGRIEFGTNNIALGDSRVAINPSSVMHGWVAWSNYAASERKKNEILGETMVSARDPKPAFETLDKRVDPGLWKDQISFNVIVIDGEGRGTQLLYKVNSKSGVREALALINRVRAQVRDAKAQGHRKVIPICRVTTVDFPTNFGKQYKPQWHLVDWVAPETDFGTYGQGQAPKEAAAKPNGGGVKEAAAKLEEASAAPEGAVPPIGRSGKSRKRPA